MANKQFPGGARVGQTVHPKKPEEDKPRQPHSVGGPSETKQPVEQSGALPGPQGPRLPVEEEPKRE